jgi:anthranilate phosphoribosyltransferase
VSAERFAEFVAILGRGPGRSRRLTREEARKAFRMMLAGEPDPHQVGAALMLLRYRGEDADELAGMVEAARQQATLPGPVAELDWPSYGAGRTRGVPWFLLSALALARSGVRVLMHGSNAFSSGVSVAFALAALGLAPAESPAQATDRLARNRFAYLPVAAISPALDGLLGLRRLFGLRSPVNTVARLLNPADAPAGIDGVFHPGYIDVHLAVAERMRRERLLVLKGAGGEAERNPRKPVSAHLWRSGEGRSELMLPALSGLHNVREDEGLERLIKVWRGEDAPPAAIATIQATIAAALLALGRFEEPAAAETVAREIWLARA